MQRQGTVGKKYSVKMSGENKGSLRALIVLMISTSTACDYRLLDYRDGCEENSEHL